MFTIKLKTGYRTIIKEAESFSILRDGPVPPDATFMVKETDPTAGIEAEITLHQRSGESCRYDIGDVRERDRPEFWPPVFQVAYIENAAGKTVEIIGSRGPQALKAA